MKRHGRWDVTVSRDEQPDYNFYTVEFADHKAHEPVARVLARVYTNFGVSAKDAHVERLKPASLDGVPDSELLQIAEIEVNTMPGLPIYVMFPGVATNLVEE